MREAKEESLDNNLGGSAELYAQQRIYRTELQYRNNEIPYARRGKGRIEIVWYEDSDFSKRSI